MKMMESRSFEVLDSHKRMVDRQAAREANHAKERELSLARLERVKRDSAYERLEKAKLRLRGSNVSTAIAVIEASSSRERDFLLLAEEFGEARKTVLREFPKPRKTVRAAVLGTPTETPEVSTETQLEALAQMRADDDGMAQKEE